MTDRPRARRSAPLAIAIRMQSRQWRALPDLRARAALAVEAGLAVAGIAPLPGAELSLLMTDDRRMAVINRDWRGLDKATNVLSFPAAPPGRIASSPVLGDIAIAYETVLREAQAEDKSMADHVSHLVIHGLLHLLGEDHETPEDAQRMEGLEIMALARLGIADPYAGSEPDADAPTSHAVQPRPS